MADYGSNLQQAGQQGTDKISRIQADTSALLTMVQRLKACEARVARHAMSLGYFQATPETGNAKPTPVSTTMVDALADMDRAIDSLSGALTLFD